MNLSLQRPIAFIDIETTGLNKQQDRIVDICIIKIHPDGTEEMLNSVINPNIPIPIGATQVHGITDADVKGKPTFNEFAQRLIDFIDKCDLGGFGAEFDLSILESEFKRVGINYSREGRKIVDVKSIYHKLEPRNLNAAHLKYCGKPLENAHKAHNDVRATIDILESQLEQHDIPRDISSLCKFCRDPAWIDDSGRFVWLGNVAVINFGRHQGRTLQDISKDTSDYLRWIIKDNFSSEVKKIAEDAIKGIFPKKQSN